MLTIPRIKEIITPICQKYGIKAAYLFGSYARGEATEKSDVDLRIERGKNSRLRGMISVSGFRLDLVDALKKDVDLLTCLPSGQLSTPFLKNLKHDEVLLYGTEQ